MPITVDQRVGSTWHKGNLNDERRAIGRLSERRTSRDYFGRAEIPFQTTKLIQLVFTGACVAYMTILMNFHRLFARDSMSKKIDAETKPSSTDTTQTLDNVVDIASAKVGGPVGTSIMDGDTPVRPGGRSGRVRTRLLPAGEEDQPYSPGEGSSHNRGGKVRRPVGWLVVIEGPGAGDWFALESGLTHLGRGADQDVCLDFGDQTISRQNHAFITYDIAYSRFQLSHGDSRNRTRLNGAVVDSKVTLTNGDRISIGKTTLRIAIFCDDHFSWPPIIDKGGSK